MPYVLVLLWLALLVYCLIDVLQADAARVRGPRKGAWIPIVLLVPYVGPILWLIRGRPAGDARPTRPALPTRRRTRASGPDDDPEFLAALARSNRQRDRERRRREQRDRPPDEPGAGPTA
jgi:hypothetical protein